MTVTVYKLVCSPASVLSGATSSCTVTLSAAAPAGGSTVTLSDNSSALTTPASVKVPAGSTTASFTATAGTVTANQSATVKATLNGSSGSWTVTVTPATTVTVSKLACSPVNVVSGTTATCTVTLSAAAPAGGSTVTISDNSSALTTPASVNIAANSTSASFPVVAGAVTTDQSITISATVNGSSTAAVLNLQAPAGTFAAAYSFDEGSGSTTADVSGNGNTGQIHGATWTSTAKHGKALSFDGGDYVDVGNGKSLQGTGSMTWSAWIYATANPADDGNIIAKSSWGSNAIGWQFKTTPDTGSHTFGILISADGNSYTERCSKTVRALKTWYHVAAVFNASAGTLDIYVNGVLDNGKLYGTVPNKQYSPALNATIGKRYDGLAFSGSIDDLRVYSRALSQSEIQTDMNNALTTVSSGNLTSSLKTPTVRQRQHLLLRPPAPLRFHRSRAFRARPRLYRRAATSPANCGSAKAAIRLFN